MSAGTVVDLFRHFQKIVAIVSDGAGTSNYIVYADGSVYTHTIADNSQTQILGPQGIPGEPVAAAFLSSYVFVALASGAIWRVTIATGAKTEILKADRSIGRPVAMCYYGAKLYVSYASGYFRSVTTS